MIRIGNQCFLDRHLCVQTVDPDLIFNVQVQHLIISSIIKMDLLVIYTGQGGYPCVHVHEVLLIPISYPESSGSLASGWSPGETLGY